MTARYLPVMTEALTKSGQLSRKVVCRGRSEVGRCTGTECGVHKFGSAIAAPRGTTGEVDVCRHAMTVESADALLA